MKRRHFWMAVTLTLLAGMMSLPHPAPLSHAQGDDVSTMFDRAVAFLGEQLGVTITAADIGRWRWEETYWPDTSMGCPQPDQAYEEANIHGFIFRIEYGGQFYAVHIVAEGDTIFLCGSEAVPAPTPYPTVVVPYDDPEALASLARNYLNQQAPSPLRFARWTWQETLWPDDSLDCPYPEMPIDDSFPKRGYAITLDTADATFEVHVTANGDRVMACNLGLEYLPMISGVLINPTVATPEAAPPDLAAQPTTPTLSNLFYTGPDGNVFAASLNDFPGRNVTSDTVAITSAEALLPRYNHTYGAFRWSPDGTLLAFIDAAEPARLLLTDITGAATVVVAEGLSPWYPPAWSPTGGEIAYVVPTDTVDGEGRVMAVYAVAPPITGATGAPRLLGTFNQGAGGGGGTIYPADELYMAETGLAGNDLTLAWLPGGQLLFSDSSLGVGLSRLNTSTGEAAVISPTVARVSLDPLLGRAAGIDLADGSAPQLVILDLAQGTRQALPLPNTPDQVHWSADGQRLYVSTVDVAGQLPVSGSEAAVPVRTVRLWEIDLATGQSLPRFEQEGRGLGLMTDSPNAGGLVFSFIEGDRGWLEARAAGGDLTTQRAAAPAIWLMVLNDQGQVTRLGKGGQPSLSPLLPAMQG